MARRGQWLRHLRLLLRKNVKLQLRRPKGTCAEVLMPTVFILLLVVIRSLVPVNKAHLLWTDECLFVGRLVDAPIPLSSTLRVRASLSSWSNLMQHVTTLDADVLAVHCQHSL